MRAGWILIQFLLFSSHIIGLKSYWYISMGYLSRVHVMKEVLTIVIKLKSDFNRQVLIGIDHFPQLNDCNTLQNLNLNCDNCDQCHFSYLYQCTLKRACKWSSCKSFHNSTPTYKHLFACK